MLHAVTGVWHRVWGALRGPRVLSLYCDGSAGERVGQAGGWAFLLVRDERLLLSGSGGAPHTTSLAMELEAAHQALTAVLARGWQRGHRVELVSDCSIALDVAAGKKVPRRQETVAMAVRDAALEVGCSTRWLPAHAGHRWNEAADALAHEARLEATPAHQRQKAPLTRS